MEIRNSYNILWYSLSISNYIFPFLTALEFTGGIPFEILQPVLERASPQQLITLEDYNSYLLEDTDVLWETHCKRDFKNKVSIDNE